MNAGTTGNRTANDERRGTAAAWLSGGLVLLATSLGAVGGLTGGIARMFRNSSTWQILPALLLVLLGVLLAVVSNLPSRQGWVIGLLAASTLLFGSGLYWSMSLMVNSSRMQDRPSLNAQLAHSAESDWILKVQASSSGLDADDQLQVLVYGQPRRGPTATPRTPPAGGAAPAGTGDRTRTSPPAAAVPAPPTAAVPAPPGGAPSAGTGDRTRTSPPAAAVPAPLLEGDRLLFTQAGANIEGVASQQLEIPLPAGRGYRTIIVTAVVGEFPRDCEGRTVNVRDNTELLVPPEVTRSGQPLEPNGTLSCLTFAAPDPVPVPSS